MTDVGASGEATAAVVLGATDRLIGDLADAVPPLRAVGDALAELAAGLGVEKVIVAVDDLSLGRQVFCSGRVPLGENGIGLTGPQGAWTQPPRALDVIASAILMRAVAAGLVRSTRRPAPDVIDLTDSHASTGATTASIDDAIAVAAARTVRHGWGFTLVLLRGPSELANCLHPKLRAADLLVTAADDQVALLLPQTAGDRVPFVLNRLATGGGVPPFSYGLACCPADGTDPVELRRTATERLETASRSGAETKAIAAR